MKNKVHLWGTHGATILGISLVLFMLGVLLVIEYHSYRLSHDTQERITYKVDLAPDVSDSLALALKADIAQMPEVKHVDYISKEQAAEIFSQDLGEDFVGFAGYNPLYPSLMVNFNVQLLPDNSTATLDRFCQQVASREGVTGVAYQENIVGELRQAFYNLSWFLIVFVALLLVITILLISSLIRIAIYGQRDTIATMRLVGAKAGFIARPFRLRSIAYGTIGGLVAVVLTALALWVADRQFLLSLLESRHLPWYAAIAAATVLTGILIAYLATAATVRRYIDKH
ncbi:MAG: permease-like cell division protein FtsX [Bacteroidales bacterium]|nr:permease-like cell division protein FtsX [Bacteroidales bacterium]